MLVAQAVEIEQPTACGYTQRICKILLAQQDVDDRWKLYEHWAAMGFNTAPGNGQGGNQ